jgi:ring-1,2-phenylacetyl-CoA epoxidase subunit PaaC
MRVAAVVSEATLTLPDVPPAVTGGRRGVHTEQMGYLLAEMQHLARSHPGASW